MTTVYICTKYDDKVIHSRQIEMSKELSEQVVDLIANLVDGIADTLIEAGKR